MIDAEWIFEDATSKEAQEYSKAFIYNKPNPRHN